MGRTVEAIEHFQELLRLNPNDNQGNRDLLGACYLETGQDAEALSLLNRYPERITASWGYTAALVQFRLHGDSQKAKTELNRAREHNPHVPYLTGRKRMPRNTPGGYTLGGEDEAVLYTNLYGECWKKTPGAIAWLESAK